MNTSNTWYKNDPFILACEASEVFYLNDTKFGGSWKVVQNLTPRNIYEVPIVLEENNEEDDHGVSDEVYQECECVGGIAFVEEADDEDLTTLPSDDAEPI